MSRSLKKGPYVEESLLRKIRKMGTGTSEPIKTWSRRSMVIPDFVGRTFAIHNGRDFQQVFITEEMVGHKLGEFAPTRRFARHGTHGRRTITPK